MTHITHLLAQYHDGELDARRRQRVERHLAVCKSCRQELGELEQLSEVLSACEMPELATRPAAFRSRVLLRLPRVSSGRKRSFSWGWLLVPASLVLMFVLVQGLWLAVDSLGVVSRVAEWSGVDLSAMADGVPSAILGSGAVGDAVSGLPLVELVRIGGYVSLYLLMLLVFAFYVGWVGVLVRSEERAGVLEGDGNGSL